MTLPAKPIADPAPAKCSAQTDRRQRLVAEGTLTPARAPEPGGPPPLARPLPGLSPSEHILAEREQDR